MPLTLADAFVVNRALVNFLNLKRSRQVGYVYGAEIVSLALISEKYIAGMPVQRRRTIISEAKI